MSTELKTICEYDRIRAKAQLVGLDVKMALNADDTRHPFSVVNERARGSQYAHLGFAADLCEAEALIATFCWELARAKVRLEDTPPKTQPVIQQQSVECDTRDPDVYKRIAELERKVDLLASIPAHDPETGSSSRS